jgi:KipI family sensor histidine kinase inhibitor
MKKAQITISASSDNSLIIYGLGARVVHFQNLLSEELKAYILDSSPAYGNLFVLYNLTSISHQELAEQILLLWNENEKKLRQGAAKKNQKNAIKIFVYYSEETGWDLLEVAQKANLSVEEVIQIHSGATYEVLAVGFAPGFAYMGDVPENICFPRRENARLRIPKGSLAIAHRQSAIYPNNGAGGWNIIGKTFQKIVDWNKKNPCLLQVGDIVKFEAISKEKFLKQGGEIVKQEKKWD